MVAASYNFFHEDDELLEGVTRQVVSDANHLFSKTRIERDGALDERTRLARELHDGVLQSLTGAALQLEAVTRLSDQDPQSVRERLREVQDLIAHEQRELRTWIQGMKGASPTAMASHADLTAALDTLCRRVMRWGPRVELTGPTEGAISRTLGDQVYRLVEESLSNVARHAHAQVARVEIRISANDVRIVVEDDGCGFPYHGRYDLAALNSRGLGPVSLKERVGSLDGDLVLTSTLSGSRLDISLPLHHRIRAKSTTYRL